MKGSVAVVPALGRDERIVVVVWEDGSWDASIGTVESTEDAVRTALAVATAKGLEIGVVSVSGSWAVRSWEVDLDVLGERKRNGDT